MKVKNITVPIELKVTNLVEMKEQTKRLAELFAEAHEIIISLENFPIDIKSDCKESL